MAASGRRVRRRKPGHEALVMSVGKALFGTREYQTMRAALDAAAMRQRVVADNIANAETPGYRPKEVAFEEYLAEATGQPALPMAQTEGGVSIPSSAAGLPVPRIVAVPDHDPGTGQLPGDFDMEKAMADLNENKVQYHAMVTLLTDHLSRIKSAIDER